MAVMTPKEIKQHRKYYEDTGYPMCPRDYLDTIDALQQEIEQLRTALDKAREALDEIFDPVKYARKRSGTVDPMRCYWMERHTGYLQTIANKALAEIDGVLESEVKGK
jgi:hypothetical protein